MKKPVLLSWSSGKDSAWALHILQKSDEYEVVGLFCTVNEAFNRVAMHGVRESLVDLQAEQAGLPMHYISIPNPCNNEQYDKVMSDFIISIKDKGIETVAFGDLFLEDIREYRESRLQGTGITAIFPLWGLDTTQLAHNMIDAGLRAKVTCLDPKKVPKELAGRTYDKRLLNDLPEAVNVCGEYGEFHTFAYKGPMFKHAIDVEVLEVVERDGFVFADVNISP